MTWKVGLLLASARRHGISEDRIAYVVRTCPMPLSLMDPEPGEEDVLLFLAHDQHGVPLEVLAVERAHDEVVVFHAMKLSRENRALYEGLMR